MISNGQTAGYWLTGFLGKKNKKTAASGSTTWASAVLRNAFIWHFRSGVAKVQPAELRWRHKYAGRVCCKWDTNMQGDWWVMGTQIKWGDSNRDTGEWGHEAKSLGASKVYRSTIQPRCQQQVKFYSILPLWIYKWFFQPGNTCKI